jgi:hypothetical protein
VRYESPLQKILIGLKFHISSWESSRSSSAKLRRATFTKNTKENLQIGTSSKARRKSQEFIWPWAPELNAWNTPQCYSIWQQVLWHTQAAGGKQIRLILLKHKHTDQHTKSRQALPRFKPVVTFQSMPTTNGPCCDWHGQHPVENPSVPSFQISGKCSPWMPCTKHGLSRSLWAEFTSPCWTQPCLKTTYLIHPHSNHPAVKVSLITVLS